MKQIDKKIHLFGRIIYLLRSPIAFIVFTEILNPAATGETGRLLGWMPFMAIFALPSESLYYNDDFTDDDVGSLNSYKLLSLSIWTAIIACNFSLNLLLLFGFQPVMDSLYAFLISKWNSEKKIKSVFILTSFRASMFFLMLTFIQSSLSTVCVIILIDIGSFALAAYYYQLFSLGRFKLSGLYHILILQFIGFATGVFARYDLSWSVFNDGQIKAVIYSGYIAAVLQEVSLFRLIFNRLSKPQWTLFLALILFVCAITALLFETYLIFILLSFLSWRIVFSFFTPEFISTKVPKHIVIVISVLLLFYLLITLFIDPDLVVALFMRLVVATGVLFSLFVHINWFKKRYY